MDTHPSRVELVDKLFLSIIHIVENEDNMDAQTLPFNLPLLGDVLNMAPGVVSEIGDAGLRKLGHDCVFEITRAIQAERLHPVCVLDLLFLIALGSHVAGTQSNTKQLLAVVGLHPSWAEIIKLKFATYYPVMSTDLFEAEDLCAQIADRLAGRGGSFDE